MWIKLILPIFFSVSLYAQTRVDTVFYNDAWEEVTEDEAFFFGIRSYNDTGIEKGVYYRSTGELYSEQEEKNGLRAGECKLYHENGELSTTGYYRKNKPVGEHHFYDVSGVYIRTDIYDKKGRLEAAYYMVNDKKVYTECKRLSSFGKYLNPNKGFVKMGRFIDQELIKPEIAEEYAESVVLASFLITPDGTIEHIKIEMSVHPALDTAVINVIKKMPEWRPAKHKGQCVYSEFSIAVSF